MLLTDDQKRLLNGQDGPLVAKYLRWLVEWGDAMQANRLVPVTNVMPGGPNIPGNIVAGASREANECILRDETEYLGTKVVPYTVTSHVARYTIQDPDTMGIDAESVALQEKILASATSSGTLATWTCTPYLVGNVPVKGQICAWTESHAVVYINSLLGARTTRHGEESAAAALVTGFVPEFGVLRDSGRKGDVLIDVRVALQTSADWGALGYYTGKKVPIGIPVFSGLRTPNIEEAKQLCAALATTGAVSMFHAIGITPEAPSLDAAFQGDIPKEKYMFDQNALKSTYRALCMATKNDIDFVYIGCPHATLSEMAEVVRLLDGRKVADKVLFVFSMPFGLKAIADRIGLTNMMEKSGVFVMTDTCPAVACFPKHKRMITNSAKQAHYLPAIMGSESVFASSRECVESALTGKWE